MPADEDIDKPQTEPQTETGGAGDSGRKIKTALAYGGGGGGNDWYSPRQGPAPESSSNRYERLRNLAIDALASAHPRDCETIYAILLSKLGSGEYAEELARVLTILVTKAYVVAQFVPKSHVLDELRFSFQGFSDKQLQRIIDLAATS
jgi:hypothetical protein